MNLYILPILFAIFSSTVARSIFSDTVDTASSFFSSLSCSIPGFCSQVPETTPIPQFAQYPQYPQIFEHSQNSYAVNPVYSQIIPVPEVPERPLYLQNTVNPQDYHTLENFNSPEKQHSSVYHELPIEKEKITCPKNGQHYPIYDDCKKYFICVSGFLEEINCPTGLYYNCMTQTCETETLHLCCKNDRTTPQNVFIVPNNSFYACREGAVNGYDPQNIAKCIDDKIYYTSCYGKNEYCMDSLQCFDSSTKSCDENALGEPYQPTDVISGIEIGLEPAESCPNKKQNFEIKDNCAAYYNCSTGEPYLYQCPEGYFYDCWNQICSRTTSVYCCYDDERYSRSTGQTDLIDWESKEYVCEDNLKVAFERINYKDSFAICSGNLLYFGSCFPNSYCNLTGACYDPNSERCLSPLSSRFSDTKVTSHHIDKTKPPSHTISGTTKRPKNKYTHNYLQTTAVPITEVETEMSSIVESEVWPPESTHSNVGEINPLPYEDEMDESPTSSIVQPPAEQSSVTAIASSHCFDRFSTLAVLDDCSKYIIYNNSIPTTYSCIGNFKFDGFKKCCVKEHTAFTNACGEDPNKSFINDVSCSDLELQNEEHPTKCNLYFTCDSFGTILEQTCPSGEVFDWQKKGCLDDGSAVTVPDCTSI